MILSKAKFCKQSLKTNSVTLTEIESIIQLIIKTEIFKWHIQNQ